MKIGLITIHNTNNYGAILQAFALQEVLSRYGEVEIINYDNRHVSISFDLIRFKPTIHGLLGMGKDIFRLFPRHRVIKKFKSFIETKIKQTEIFTNKDLASGGANGFDCYFAGSDQIWNPDCISDNSVLNPIYFLDFAPKGAKKNSYATSMGGHQFTIYEKQQLKELLDDFDTISVREKGAQLMLQDILKRPVHHVLDPTLLLSKDEWAERVGFQTQRESQEKYILLYTVPKVPLIRSAVDYFSQKLGLKVISIEQGLSAGANVDKQIRDAGPKEYLQLFASAEFVITDSFHGVCFAVNFEKAFVAISPGKHSNRIESLLSVIGLEERLVKTEADFDCVELNVDFDTALFKLDNSRISSIDLLTKSLENVSVEASL